MALGDFVWSPDEGIVQNSNLQRFLSQHGLSDFAALGKRALDEPHWFWNAVIEHHDIRFSRPYDRILDLSDGVAWPRWCINGQTNLATNCLDRNLELGRGDVTAIVYEGEDGTVRRWTYAELAAASARCAAGLRAIGLGRGDVVALYMPMVPEVAAGFFAIASIGAVALPLFSGFGPAAVAGRLRDASAKAVITADGTMRRGRVIEMKTTLDRALDEAPSVRKVVVLGHLGIATGLVEGRDHDWHELTSGAETSAPAVEMDADDPLMVIFTSGTTGRPKGTIHTHCGAMVKNALDLGMLLDMRTGDVLLWMSDMGWLVGPKTIIGSALLGATLILAEGTPDYPDDGRLLRLAEEHNATFLGMAPTVARSFMGQDPAIVTRHDLSSLRVLVSTGELWDRDSWLWFFNAVGKGRRPILNYAGGTEIGGAILIGTVHHPLRPCAFGGPVPGTGAVIVDAEGQPVPEGRKGELAMQQTSIGLTRGLWNDRQRYMDTYWNRHPGLWLQGDVASVDSDGLWYLHGRADDTIKVAGKRTGPGEIEQLLLETGLVSEAAAVGVPDALKGEAIVCACVRNRTADTPDAEAAEILGDAVAAGLGTPFRPREIRFVEDLPKTRNQKIMRRVVRAILSGEDPGDVSALANPEILPGLGGAGSS